MCESICLLSKNSAHKSIAIYTNLIYFVFVIKCANFVIIINRLRIISQAQSIQTNEEIILFSMPYGIRNLYELMLC